MYFDAEIKIIDGQPVLIYETKTGYEKTLFSLSKQTGVDKIMTQVRFILVVALAILAIFTTVLSVILIQGLTHFEAAISIFWYGGLLVVISGTMLLFWVSKKKFLLEVKQKKARLAMESEMPELHLVIRRLCQNAKLPLPEIYITPSLSPDIFIGGKNPQESVLIITKGINRAT
ncbi:hypothetical protein M1N64_04595 [Peptococcaceae bacterium]|nr:hypothetical protein [Peptococcaceae bacterium]